VLKSFNFHMKSQFVFVN